MKIIGFQLKECWRERLWAKISLHKFYFGHGIGQPENGTELFVMASTSKLGGK